VSAIFSHPAAPQPAPKRGTTRLAFIAPPTPTGVADVTELDLLDVLAEVA